MILSFDKLKPGMFLLEDVFAPNGKIILNSGVSLTKATIDMLRLHGVTSVQVVGEVPQSAPAAAGVAAAAPDTAGQTTTPLQKMPRLVVDIAPDSMSVKLRIEPLKESENQLTFADVVDGLKEVGVSHGINEGAINTFIEKWNKLKKFYEISNIATGISPQPGREGALKFKVSTLSDRTVIERARSAAYYWEIPGPGIKLERVDPNTAIAEKQAGVPPIPGVNIRGEPVFTDEVIKQPVKLGFGVAWNREETALIAQASGIVFESDEGLIGIVTVNFGGSIDVEVQENGMRAVMNFHAPGPGGAFPKRNEIMGLLVEKGVCYGQKDDVLDKLFIDLAKNNFPLQPLAVAEGDAPQNGENGKIEYLFNTATSLKPKVNADGSADFKNIDIVNAVSKGDKLARLVAETKGTPGKDIFGKILAAKDGVAATLPIGPNTEVDPEDDSVLLASVDGNARLNNKVVEVSEGYVIKGNVDLSTGNVKYNKSVTVMNDVQSGFSIEAGGDLQVNGTIEDATLLIGGNTLCRYGFVGTGKGSIECKGDVNLGFLKNQSVRSRGTVTIAKEVLNATIFARKSIILHGNPLSVAGGRLVARDAIELHTVGNSGGTRTQLEIGLDFALLEELEKTEAQLAEAAGNLHKLLDTYKKYDQLQKIKKKLEGKDAEIFTKIKQTLVKYKQQIQALDERKNIINAKMHQFDHAYIRIEHAAMPGTLIKIGERHFLVKEEIIGPKTVRLINFEIRVL